VESCLSQVKRVVVVGSGTLALETIETLRHRGYQVVHLLRKQILWSEILDATASDLVLQQEQRDGVEVRQGEEIAEISGQHGQVSGVVTTNGKQIPCELVLIAIGIDPIIDFVTRSGIACRRGIMVDASMRTIAPDIYAAGDVLETTDPLTGRSRVIGQWYPAIQQARAAAYAMLGILDTTRSFLARLRQENRGYQELIADPQPRTYQKAILKGGIPVGMLALGNRKGVLAYKRAIDYQVNLSPILDMLFAPTFQLDAWLDRQGVPPILSGVTRASAPVPRYDGSSTPAKRLFLAPQLVLPVRANER
jgi:NAD(P)H-nitrite reductase large subunit